MSYHMPDGWDLLLVSSVMNDFKDKWLIIYSYFSGAILLSSSDFSVRILHG